MAITICFLSMTHRHDDTRILQKEARALADAGFRVFHLAPGAIDSYSLYGVHVEIYPRARGLFARALNFFRLYRRAIKINAEYYHCNEVESWLVGLLIKLCHPNKRIIFDVHEHYPSRFNEPHWPKWMGYFGKPLILFLYRVLIPWTDYLILAKRSISRDFRCNSSKYSFIFNYASIDFQFRSREEVPEYIQKEFEGCKVAVHIGGLSHARGWPQLLKALTLMKNKKMKVMCIGEIAEGKDIFLAKAENLGVASRVKLIDHVPFERLFDYLLCSDIGLMLYQPGIQNHVFAFPIKMYEYMLAGLPVIAPDFAIEVEPIIREEKCGLLINTAESKQIASALDYLCDDPKLAREMGGMGRKAVIEKYNWEIQAKKLVRIYSNLKTLSVR